MGLGEAGEMILEAVDCGGVSVGLVLPAALFRVGLQEPDVGELGLQDPARLWSGQEVLAVFADVGVGASACLGGQ
jgi:hypothetical protein